MLSWALAAHPDFWTSAESDFLRLLFGDGRLFQSYQKAHKRSGEGWLRKNQVTYDEFAAYVGWGIDQLFLSRSNDRRWVDSTPGYTLIAEELCRMFPGARFLHVLRDGRAVVNSMIRSGFDTSFAKNFGAACKVWSQYATAGQVFQESHAERALEVRHERLEADPEGEIGRILGFLGAAQSDLPAQHLRNKRINSSYGNVQAGDIRKPKDPSILPKEPWRAWSWMRKRVFRGVAGPAMRKLGYPLDLG